MCNLLEFEFNCFLANEIKLNDICHRYRPFTQMGTAMHQLKFKYNFKQSTL